jgi:predicted transcriptional regulator
MRLIDALSVIRHSLAVNIPIGEPARGLIGYLNARDLISMLKSDGESENLEVRQVMKSFPGEFMEHTSIEAIMPIFHKNRNACVLVKDIWGNIVGIIDADQIDHALYWHNHLRKPTV